ncbi:uncharacterized protein LOC116291149, partial [Actinia tenebrosa]|uniref:Uncharacterized protein LOC116291149 n=1 Tax=Actinia tenebrosa TaxID=6105 RepID=A0A6P8HNC7_ACTTE
MAEYEDPLEILIRNRFHLVQHLQVERPLLMEYLLSKSVFDRNDYDLVRSEKTREQKACKVLDIIETKGENGFKHFKDVLQLINPNLYETLTGEKATYRDSPILDTMGLSDGNRLIDQDILSSHLKRVTDDLRDMTLRYNTVLKEDQQLRRAMEVSKQE